MNDILFLFLSLSLSGSILALILLAIKPLVKNRLSQTWQYYIWLVVILRFLLPFTPQISVVGEMTRQLQDVINAPIVSEANQNHDTNEYNTIPDVTYDPSLLEATQNAKPETPLQAHKEILAHNEVSKPPAYWRDILDNIWLLWAGVALVLFVHKVASYRSFVRFVNAGKNKVTDTHMLDIYADELEAAKVKRQLPLYINEQVVSPMLVGILRPALVLPVLETSDDELRQIFRHEFTHFKRWDSLYKWIVQITLCLHWFNPLVYLINKQINKSCELSCDESVIKHLDEDGRITYGDALMASLTAQGKYSNFVVSITMSENLNIVKERLDMIMSYKKKSGFVICITAILTVIMLCGFTVAGAYAVTQPKVNENIASTKAVDGITETFEAQDVKNINMLVRNCNVIIRYSVNDQFLFDYDKTKNKITYETKNSTVTINVESIVDTRSTSFENMPVIYIPERLYDNITVTGERAGIALPRLYANLHLTNNGGSMSVSVPDGFDKTIDFESVNGSGALMIDASAENFLLTVTSQGSAVGVSPNLPTFTPNRTWEYKNGNGKAKIDLDLQGSSFSIQVSEPNSKPITTKDGTAETSGAKQATSYVIECVSEEIIVKQEGSEFKVEPDLKNQSSYRTRNNTNIPMGDRYYRYNKWDVIFERTDRNNVSAAYSPTVIVTIPAGIDGQELLLITNSGNIIAKNLNNVRITAESESGNIFITDTNTEYISAETVNGNIEFKNVISKTDIRTRSINGTVSVNGDESDAPSKKNDENSKQSAEPYWTEEEFISFMQEQEQGYKALLAKGDITQEEFDVFISTDKDILKEIQNGTKISKSATGSIYNPLYTSYSDSMIRNFEKYKPFGIVYNSESDAVFYNGERVRLFVDFKQEKEKDMHYAFDLCFQESLKVGTLCLEAIEDENGKVMGVRKLDDDKASQLLWDLDSAKEPSKPDVKIMAFDGGTKIERYGLDARDITKEKAPANIKTWMAECDKQHGAFIKQNKTDSGYITYIYYNKGGRYPWNVDVSNGKVCVYLYSDINLATDDGYTLLYYTAPTHYDSILFLDGTELDY